VLLPLSPSLASADPMAAARGAAGLLLLVLVSVTARRAGAWSAAPHEELVLRDTLWKQNLGHRELHSWLKLHLLKLVRRRSPWTAQTSCVVLGVEDGGEMFQFARAGCATHGFEPHPFYFASAVNKTALFNRKHAPGSTHGGKHAGHAFKPAGHVTVHHVAMGAKAGTLRLKDLSSSSTMWAGAATGAHVPITTVDAFAAAQIPGEIAVLAVDIDGPDIDALRGAQETLPRVQQVWVEFRACEKGNAALLRLLNRTHAIYDMRWWGVPKTRWPTYDFAKDFWAEGMPRADERPDTRPPSGSADEYLRAFCSAREGRQFLQTDLVAVRRDLLTSDLTALFSRLSSDHDKALRSGNLTIRLGGVS
jgi:hypothetical protein